MIRTSVDDTPIATSANTITYPLPTIPTPISNNTSNAMNSDNDFYSWISTYWLIFLSDYSSILSDRSPESEFASPDFGHTPLQTFEDGVDDTPLIEHLVTPQQADLDSFTDDNGKPLVDDDFEGLFTMPMDESPEALMSYWDSGTFGSVTGTGVEADSTANDFFPFTTDNEPIALMGPPTNVSFADLWSEPSKKRRKVNESQMLVVEEESENTIAPADMHMSGPTTPNKEKDAKAMPPPDEVPIHLSSTHSGVSSTSPKPRVPTATNPNADITASALAPYMTPSASNSNTKKSNRKYTGTRTGLTPSKLIPMDAPVQTRNYITPSSTSRKELPAAFAEKVAQAQLSNLRGKKRAISEVDSPNPDTDEVLELGGVALPSGDVATIQVAIDAKRLQNTQAARRSRARKLEYLKGLEDRVAELEVENDVLRKRNGELEVMFLHRGGPT